MIPMVSRLWRPWRYWHALPLALLVAVGSLGGMALAQSPLPSLETLRGLTPPQPSASELLDRARSEGSAPSDARTMAASDEGGEQEINAFQAFCRGGRNLPLTNLTTSRFSRLEHDYCRRAGTPIFQFGYETFSRGASSSTLGIGSMPEHYMLGIGDELIVTFYGQTTGTHAVRVDREGRVVLPNMPPIPAAGRRFDEFRRELEARTQATFLGTEVFVSVGSVRQISVTVIGEVRRPGIHRLTALSTLLDAIGLAGGVSKTGSLRNIRVFRGSKPLDIDLYDVLLTGVFDYELSLFEGDRIFVPTIGATVAISGEVTRPGIYELPNGQDQIGQEELLKYAGGTLRPTGHSYLKSSFSTDGREVVTQSNRRSDTISAGDVVTVRTLRDAQTGSVALQGHVTQPGSVALAYASTLRALVGDALNLLPGAYLPFAILQRVDAETGASKLQAVNLERVLTGASDVQLRDGDGLFVFGPDDVAYLRSTEVRDVILGRPVPGLATVVSTRQEIALRSPRPADNVATSRLGSAGSGEVPPECAGLSALAAIFSAGETRRFEAVVQARFSEERVEYRLNPPCPPLFVHNGELLPFALEHAAAVLGDVHRPGIYPVVPDMPLETLVAAAGGLRQGATDVRLELSRTPETGATRVARLNLNATATDTSQLASVKVGPTDIIRFSGSWVELAGHVRTPGLRPLSAASSLGALIGSRAALADDPYLLFAVLETTDSATQARRLTGVNLEKVLSGERDLKLRDHDRLIVLSRDEIRYLMSTDVRHLILRRPVPGLSTLASEQEAVRRELSSVGERAEAEPGEARLPEAGACPGLEALALLLSSGEGRRFDSALLAGIDDESIEYNLRRDCPSVYRRHPEVLPFVLENAVALTGLVRDPGVYPVAPQTRLSSLISVAGGLTSEGGRLSAEIARLRDGGSNSTAPGRRLSIDVARGVPSNVLVGPSEVVRFHGQWVELVGQVDTPGRRAVSAAPTVGALIGNRDNLGEDPYLLFAVLETTDAATRSRRLFPVNLERVLNGEEDVALREGDKLVVLSRDDVRYLMSTDVKNVMLGREVPGLVSIPSALEEIRRQTGEEEPGVEARQRRAVAAAEVDICPGLQTLAMVMAVGKTQRFDNALLAGLAEGAVEYNLRRDCPSVYKSFPDLLPFALEHVTAMNGEIRRPGAYPITPRTRLSSLISVADGMTRDTDLLRVEISRLVPGSGSVGGKVERSTVDMSNEEPRNVFVEPSDIVRFNAKFTDRDKGPVVLSGEFMRPGIYVIRKGERLSELIARAGGLTSQAFPYGAIFTRERVKRAEAQALKRAAREIDAAVSVLASKSNIDPKQLATITRLSQQLESAEAIGRVVIEADPTVLQSRPELDTVLEAGDRLFLPKRPNYVTISGDVLSPSTVQFRPGATVSDYIARAGGYQIAADDSRVFVVFPNGEARQVGASLWNFQPVQIPPGSTIVVPRDPQPFDLLEIARDITPVLSNLVVTAASLAVIGR